MPANNPTEWCPTEAPVPKQKMKTKHARSQEAVKRLVVINPVTRPHRKIRNGGVGSSLLATVPVPMVKRERKSLIWELVSFVPPALHRQGDGD